jgi:hypothetical protein
MKVTDKQGELMNTARITGIWYLMLAITGILGFMIFHSRVYNADPEQTLTNLVKGESIARIRLLLEFGIIISQALAAVWFYRLFRKINASAALATAIWGTVNSILIAISAISMGAAIKVAQSSHLLEDKIVMIDLLNLLITNAWSVGGLFFGLWLIPMGYIITESKRMPVWLGRTLILGGFGYLISTGLSYGGISGSWLYTLTLPASVGEFWMIGYLLIFGIRPEKD